VEKPSNQLLFEIPIAPFYLHQSSLSNFLLGCNIGVHKPHVIDISHINLHKPLGTYTIILLEKKLALLHKQNFLLPLYPSPSFPRLCWARSAEFDFSSSLPEKGGSRRVGFSWCLGYLSNWS
jgi:hypothetical protein